MTQLAEQTTTAAADTLEAADVAVLPTGSTEQHGPALPLGMDHMAAQAFARTAAEEKNAADDDVSAVVLPTIPVGVSVHHRQFDGTLYVSEETFEQYVTETLSSLAEHGLRKAVVVNGHGGNGGALRRTARRLRDEETAFAPPWNWWDAVDDLADDLFDEVGGHADAMESSLLWHVREELVVPDELEAAEAGASEGWGETVHGAPIGFDTIDFTETGAVGRPSQAAPEKGEKLFETGCDRLCALIDWLAERSLEDCWSREHR
ncbi:creatininase family protein [Halobiforma nitratireducens]|uniref:Creatininase n=1 Tax=Halobiforma nitratireducens JCM 10879 TaxID=1227454 RepID=M0MBL9_9EURY|nr:creatininase family protein [Halobiforma nitratireducens]EMA41800.1 creatininase [Halobiforma nitratireducens JCM 10879]